MKSSLVKKLFFALGVIIVIALVVLAWRELRPKKPIPDLIELPQRGDRPLDNLAPETTSSNIQQSDAGPQAADTKTSGVKLLFDQPLGFIDVNYPYLYGYDYTDKNIKVFNLEDKTFKELYSGGDISFVSFSPFKNLLAFKRRVGGLERFYLLDLVRDKISPLDFSVKKVGWGDGDDLVYYYSDNAQVNYIGRISDGRDSKIADIGLLNPSFEFHQGKLFIVGERQSPLFLVNPATQERQTLLVPKQFIALKSSNNRLFVSYPDSSWRSFLLDQAGRVLQTFNWGTLAQKCSLKEILVCGVPFDQNTAGLPRDWLELRKSFSDKLVIFDEANSDLREIALGEDFDIILPQITPLGVVFLNRLDSKVYLVPLSSLALE